MLEVKLEHKKLSEFLLSADKKIQKSVKKAVNAGNRAAHREGYKVVSKSYKISRDEYKNRKTRVWSIRLSDFKDLDKVKANVQSDTKGIGLLRFALNKKRVPMKGKRKSLRRPVIVKLSGKTEKVRGGFIARPSKDKKEIMFSQSIRRTANGSGKKRRLRAYTV